MSAALISGKALAAAVKEEVRRGVSELKANGLAPCLAVILVGDDAASQVYVRGKENDAAECGILSHKYALPETTTQPELMALVAGLSADDTVHGILVQLPLPAHLDEKAVLAAIPPEKDVDGFTAVNMGRLWAGENCFVPCTPAGCLTMLKSTGLALEGKKAVVIGRSNIVGKPMAALLLQENCTVTVCHSKTRELAATAAEADILVAAIGRAGFVTPDFIKPGAVVIDVGINRNAEGKLCGDVAPAAAGKAAFLTPVPGGVGLMTRAMLMQNTLLAARRAAGR